jgi:GNAT superfamily N-acetyltransferase
MSLFSTSMEGEGTWKCSTPANAYQARGVNSKKSSPVKPHRSLWVLALLICAGALVVGVTMIRERSPSELGISFVGYTNWIFGKVAFFSVKNGGRLPLEWWYISTEVEGESRDMPPVYVSPDLAALLASRRQAGERILVAVGEPPGPGRWRVQFQYARSTLTERLLRFGAKHRAPPALLAPVWPRRLMTNSIWLTPKRAEVWYVVRGERGRGVGRLLIKGAERWALEAGFSELASDAEMDNHDAVRLTPF